MNFRKQVREVGVTPLAPNSLAEAGPEELGRRAREEDVVSILHRAAQGTNPISWSVTLEDLNPRGKASPDPLPHEDTDLQRQADGPHRRKGRRGGGGGNGLVEGLGGELA